MKDLNRLKVVLVEKKRTSKWLAEELGKNVATVSKWCTNTIQPDLPTLNRIAELLECRSKGINQWQRLNDLSIAQIHFSQIISYVEYDYRRI